MARSGAEMAGMTLPGKPEWRAMLAYVAELHARSVHPPEHHWPHPWEEMEAITFLLDAGADINSIEEDDSGKRITLLEAASRGDIETKYSNWTIYSYLRSRGAKTLAELEEQA